MKKRILSVALVVVVAVFLSGCDIASWNSGINDIKGQLVGKEIQSCGDTVIFEEKGLKPDAEFRLSDIESISSGSFSENTIISGIVNDYKNFFGKGQVVVIQSQLGVPICAYSGDDVHYEIRNDLPKTTKLMIDNKALYVHRANFQIIDKDLID